MPIYHVVHDLSFEFEVVSFKKVKINNCRYTIFYNQKHNFVLVKEYAWIAL